MQLHHIHKQQSKHSGGTLTVNACRRSLACGTYMQFINNITSPRQQWDPHGSLGATIFRPARHNWFLEGKKHQKHLLPAGATTCMSAPATALSPACKIQCLSTETARTVSGCRRNIVVSACCNSVQQKQNKHAINTTNAVNLHAGSTDNGATGELHIGTSANVDTEAKRQIREVVVSKARVGQVHYIKT